LRNALTGFNNSEQAGNDAVSATGIFSYSETLSGSQPRSAALATFR
jgi:hypothetical protein